MGLLISFGTIHRLYYLARPQNKFPGAVYRNKTKFIGTDTENVEIFFNIFTSGIEIFHTVGLALVSLCRSSLPPGIGNTVWTPISVCHSENAEADRTGIP